MWRKNLWTLVAAVMLCGSSYTMIIPFLPIYLLELGVAQTDVKIWSGIIFSVTFLVAALLAPYWGRRADRSGKKKMIMRAGFSLAVVYFCGSLVHSPVELLGVRVLQGVANGFVPAAMAIVATSTPPDQLGFSMGIMQAGLVVGGIIGPLIGGVLSHIFGMRLSFVVSSLGVFLATVAVVFLVDETATPPPPKESSLWKDLQTAFANPVLMRVLLLSFAVQTASNALQPLITLYVAELQHTFEGVVLTAGIVYSLAGVASAMAAPIWGRMGQMRGFTTLMVLSLIGAGIFNLGQFWAKDIYQFGILQFFYGLFIVGLFPAINTLAVGSIDASFQGRVFGLTTSANQLGAMLGPLLGGFLSSWIGIRPVFLFTGGALLIFAAVVRRVFPRNQYT